MKGTFYGIGVGPGDPELVTLKALRIMEACQAIVLPVSAADFTEAVYDAGGKDGAYAGLLENCVAYRIAVGAGARIADKPKLYVPMPMIKDRERLCEAHDQGAVETARLLDQGMDAAFLTLGDPTVYSTCMYVHKRIKAMGYDTVIVPGVPSFCAAAAALDESLVENRDELHVIPASYGIEEALRLPGTKVLMKAGKKVPYVKEAVRAQQLEVSMVENCGMDTEKRYASAEEIPDQPSYYSLFIIKE